MADRETVLLEVINTKHKKTGGSLRLMSNNLIWIPYGSDNPKMSCAYSEIKGKIDRRCDFSYMSRVLKSGLAVKFIWLNCVKLKTPSIMSVSIEDCKDITQNAWFNSFHWKHFEVVVLISNLNPFFLSPNVL